MSKVFVSYKRADKAKVFPIVRKLESELGFKFWLDLEGIDGDSQFTRVIIDAINDCDVFLFMYSKAHEKIIDTENDFTVRELNYAHKKHKRIVFIDIEDTNLPDWFIFNFPQKQVTQANDNRAMGKLVADICKWLHLTQMGNHPQAIDLGLPSGTKWASCNVGATKPEEVGDYFAWGETGEKRIYDWKTYIHCDGDADSCHDIGSDISGTKYDVAHLKWGGNWQMSTLDQIDELFDNCSEEWLTLNGVNGHKYTSKFNGNSIFMPAANGPRDCGHYWTSTRLPSFIDVAWNLIFRSDGSIYWCEEAIFRGACVRPVSKN